MRRRHRIAGEVRLTAVAKATAGQEGGRHISIPLKHSRLNLGLLIPQKLAAWTAGSVGVIGIFLAALGLYGLMAFFGGTAVLFAIVLAAACWPSARRAASTDPATALRAE